MAQYLRMLVNRRYWDRPEGDYSWLDEGQLPADSLTQLRSHQNALSVFDATNVSNIDRIIAALAIKRTSRDQDFDYAIIQSSFLDKKGIDIEKSVGITPDKEVNAWHYELIRLDDEKAWAIAEYLMSGNTFRKLAGEVIDLLKQFNGK